MLKVIQLVLLLSISTVDARPTWNSYGGRLGFDFPQLQRRQNGTDPSSCGLGTLFNTTDLLCDPLIPGEPGYCWPGYSYAPGGTCTQDSVTGVNITSTGCATGCNTADQFGNNFTGYLISSDGHTCVCELPYYYDDQGNCSPCADGFFPMVADGFASSCVSPAPPGYVDAPLISDCFEIQAAQLQAAADALAGNAPPVESATSTNSASNTIDSSATGTATAFDPNATSTTPGSSMSGGVGPNSTSSSNSTSPMGVGSLSGNATIPSGSVNGSSTGVGSGSGLGSGTGNGSGIGSLGGASSTTNANNNSNGTININNTNINNQGSTTSSTTNNNNNNYYGSNGGVSAGSIGFNGASSNFGSSIGNGGSNGAAAGVAGVAGVAGAAGWNTGSSNSGSNISSPNTASSSASTNQGTINNAPTNPGAGSNSGSINNGNNVNVPAPIQPQRPAVVAPRPESPDQAQLTSPRLPSIATVTVFQPELARQTVVIAPQTTITLNAPLQVNNVVSIVTIALATTTSTLFVIRDPSQGPTPTPSPDPSAATAASSNKLVTVTVVKSNAVRAASRRTIFALSIISAVFLSRL